MRENSGINLDGLWICGGIAFVMLILKLSLIDSWSWWRVMLPIGLFFGYLVTHVVVAFIYLTFADLPDRSEEEESDILEPLSINTQYIAAMLCFVVFGDNLVRWIEDNGTSYWFWLFSGKGGTVALFGVLSVMSLFLYWFRLGRALKSSDWPSAN